MMTDEIQKRIFIVSPTESGMTKRGNRHPVLAESLHARGCSVVYLTTNFYHAEQRWFSREEICRYKSNTPFTCKVFRMLAYHDNASVWRMLGNIKVALTMFVHLVFVLRKEDVLLVPSRPPEFVLLAAILKLLRRNRVVIDVRDVWPDGLPLQQTLPHKLFALYCRIIYRVSVSSSDYLMYIAPGFLTWINRYIRKGVPADFIPLGFDEKRWDGFEPLRKDDIGSPVNLVFVGDLAKSMKVDALVKAIAGDKRVTLTFIGGGENSESIRRLADEEKADNIHFTGYLPKDQLTERMHNFHIAVIPMNLKYAMPNKLFDAIGSFRPILVFGRNDAAEFVEKNEIGWVLNFKLDEMKSFIENLDVRQILFFSSSIGKIRDGLSKERLYDKAICKLVQ